MIPYRLLLVSCGKPNTPNGISTSNHMLAWGLWEEFSKLPHVSLVYQDSGAPLTNQDPSARQTPITFSVQNPVDFVLIHSYFGTPIFEKIPELRSLTRHKIINFIELALPPCLVDYNFVFLAKPEEIAEHRAEQISFPCIKSLLDASLEGVVKQPGSVLLDHTWLQYGGTNKLWCDRLYQWLEPLKDSRMVGQMRRPNHDVGHTFPDWLKAVPETNYPNYLNLTAPYENYVLTHPGTYEHSIVDMVARGIRVMVPVVGGVPFAPRPIVDDMHLTTFSSQEEFLAKLAEPIDKSDWRRNLCTDMPDIVARIDSYCQNEMKKDV